ncbi:MAG: guanylate kinase [Bacteroidia bacterium]|nr:guanylate kinase [Bacteroidia bacterium]
MKKKAIIISAPSGAGKSTIVEHLLKRFPRLEFSVSACSRPKRGCEVAGKDYHFLSLDEFRNKIARDEFVEWEEVYPGSYYGTLKSELERIWKSGKVPVFDVDVVGGINLKRYLSEQALAIFIQPPSIQALEERLRNRATDSEESLKKRLVKAESELTYAGKFDRIVINDDLEKATSETEELVRTWIPDAGCQICDT